jgi:hypothetical protein
MKLILAEIGIQPVVELNDATLQDLWPNSKPGLVWDSLRSFNRDVMFVAHTHFMPNSVLSSKPDVLLLNFRKISDSIVSWIDHVDRALVSNPTMPEVRVPYLYTRDFLSLDKESREVSVILQFGLDLVRYVKEWVDVLPALRDYDFALKHSDTLTSDCMQGTTTNPRIVFYEQVISNPTLISHNLAQLLRPTSEVVIDLSPEKLAAIKIKENNFNVGISGRGANLSKPAQELLQAVLTARDLNAWY